MAEDKKFVPSERSRKIAAAGRQLATMRLERENRRRARELLAKAEAILAERRKKPEQMPE